MQNIISSGVAEIPTGKDLYRIKAYAKKMHQKHPKWSAEKLATVVQKKFNILIVDEGINIENPTVRKTGTIAVQPNRIGKNGQ